MSPRSPPPPPRPLRRAIDFGPEEEADEPAASELSAEELVERIEAATELVNEFEERQRLGIEALQAAIQQPRAASSFRRNPNGAVLPIAGAVAKRRAAACRSRIAGRPNFGSRGRT